MEVISQSIRGNYEEYLIFTTVPFVSPPVGDGNSVGFQFRPGLVDVANQYGGALVAGSATVHCEAEANSVSFKNNAGRCAFRPVNFGEPESLGVPLRGLDGVLYWQFQFTIVKEESGLKQSLASTTVAD